MGSKLKKWGLRLGAFGVGGAIFAGVGAALLSCSGIQKPLLTYLLDKQGIRAHFEHVSIGFLFSDQISARRATLDLPNGCRVSIENFSAKHNGIDGLFTGRPSFRNFSCEGLGFDDARGRRQFGFSCAAKEIAAAFEPLGSIEKYSVGSPLPFSINARELLVTAKGKNLAQGNISGLFLGAEPIVLSGKIHGDFAALMDQPVLTSVNNIAAGSFTLLGEGDTITLALRDLHSRRGSIRIPELDVVAKRGDGSSGTLHVELFGEERSTLNINFSHLEFGDGVFGFHGKATADTLVVADIARTGMLFRGWSTKRTEKPTVPARPPIVVPPPATVPQPDTPPAPHPEPSPESPDSTPGFFTRERESLAFWHGVNGELEFSAKRVILPSNTIGAHHGKLSVTEDTVALVISVPEFYSGAVETEGTLHFEKSAPHYRLQGTTKGSHIGLHNIFPLFRAGENVPVQGAFDFSATLSAVADVPEKLEKNLHAKFSLWNSEPGRVRIFNANSKKVKLAGEINKVGGKLVSMLSGLTRNIEPRAVEIAEGFIALQKELSDFSYTRLQLTGEYNTGGKLLCNSFSLLGENVSVSGQGCIRPIANEIPARWPIEIQADISTRGEISEALKKFNLLNPDAQPDANGFIPTQKFDFSGRGEDLSEKLLETLRDASAGKKIQGEKDQRETMSSLLEALL